LQKNLRNPYHKKDLSILYIKVAGNRKSKMIIKNKWTSNNNNDIEENNSLIELSSLWSSQISVTTTKLSLITEGPIKYTNIKK
jgi:hypothetical protein